MKLGQYLIKSVTYCGYFLSRIFTIIIFSITLFFSACFSASSQEVIAYPNAESTLSRNALRSIFSMRLQTWSDGTATTVFILDPMGESHRKFCLNSLNIFPYQLQRVWDVLVFSGTGQSPIVVKTEQEMIARVQSTPGAIGYISESEVPADVKKISIE